MLFFLMYSPNIWRRTKSLPQGALSASRRWVSSNCSHTSPPRFGATRERFRADWCWSMLSRPQGSRLSAYSYRSSDPHFSTRCYSVPVYPHFYCSTVYYIRQFDIYLLKPYYFLHRLHTTVQYTIIHVRQRWERVWASRSSTNLLRVVKSLVWAKILPSLPQTSFLGLVFSLGLLSLVCCMFCFKNLDYWLWDFDCLALIYIL